MEKNKFLQTAKKYILNINTNDQYSKMIHRFQLIPRSRRLLLYPFNSTILFNRFLLILHKINNHRKKEHVQEKERCVASVACVKQCRFFLDFESIDEQYV